MYTGTVQYRCTELVISHLGEEEGEKGGDEGGPGCEVVRDVQAVEVVQPLGVGPRPVEIRDGLGQLHSSLASLFCNVLKQ